MRLLESISARMYVCGNCRINEPISKEGESLGVFHS